MKRRQPTSEELASLSLAALRNAEGLLDDAALLLGNHRPARAYSLAALALEEYAKHIMVFSAIRRTIIEPGYWPRFWKRFRDHSEKVDLGQMIVSDWGLSFTYTDERLRTDIETALRTKLRGLYVDWTDTGLSEPVVAVTAEAATALIADVGCWVAVSAKLFEGMDGAGAARVAKGRLGRLGMLMGLPDLPDSELTPDTDS
jgi:AbiV family abortive infection protein